VTPRRSPALALAWSAGVAGFAGLGCSATVSSSTGDAEARLSTSAVVVVERMVDPAGGSRAEASARFVRVASPVSTDEALQAIGAAVILPAAGHCVPLASLSSASPLTEPAPVVELIDVGSVSLDAEGRQTHLVSRLLPDVTDVVSGLVYARTADPTLLPAESRYTLRVGGRSDLAPIELTALAPADPTNVLTGGTDVQGTLVVTGPALAFSWPAGAEADVLYVDLQPGGVRCVLGGETTAGDPLVRASIQTALLGDSGTLVVHRLRSEPFVAQGLEGGELRFDFGRSLSYVRH
jgi:hypothetical protein